MKCRGYQYELGKTEETDQAVLCEAGFHACERPLDVLAYYGPANSRYFLADLEDVSPERNPDDTKVVGKKITMQAELSIAGLCKAHFDYIKEHTTMEHTDPKMATAGYAGAATAGEYGAATAGDGGAATAGNRGAATAGDGGAATAGEYGAATAGYAGAATAGDGGAATAGYAGAATSRGRVSVGKNGCGLVRGNGVKIRGGLGAVLVICEEARSSYDIASWVSVIVDGETIKADTWYTLVNGEFVEVEGER